MHKMKRRMTSLDAAFYFAENKKNPMHIGAVDIIDGDITAAELAERLDAKLHLVPRYRQKLVPAPFHVGLPTWEDDETFDIHNHVVEVRLPKPGTEAQLMRVCGKLFEAVLDRDKPLWKIIVIRGLEGGKSAMLFLVHHCMVDGVSGTEIWSVLMDVTPDAKTSAKVPFEPAKLPTREELFADALWDNAHDLIDNVSEFQRGSLEFARNVRGDQGIALGRNLRSLVRDLTKPIKRFPFNSRSFSGHRKLSWSSISFAEVRAIRNECGGTVNDVVLTALGGALRKYAGHHGMRVDRDSARIFVPVSVRSAEQGGSLGNKVSFLPVDVPMGPDSPLERLAAVTERTILLKKVRLANLFDLMTHYWRATAAPLQRILGAAVFAPRLQGALDLVARTPLMHMVCTNVPGPQVPLYCLGKQVLAHVPLLPVAPGMGLNMGVFSYNQRIYFGFIADSAAAPDVRLFNRYMDQAFAELRDAAGVKPIPMVELSSGSNADRAQYGSTPIGEALAKEIAAALKAEKKPAAPAAVEVNV